MRSLVRIQSSRPFSPCAASPVLRFTLRPPFIRCPPRLWKWCPLDFAGHCRFFAASPPKLRPASAGCRRRSASSCSRPLPLFCRCLAFPPHPGITEGHRAGQGCRVWSTPCAFVFRTAMTKPGTVQPLAESLTRVVPCPPFGARGEGKTTAAANCGGATLCGAAIPGARWPFGYGVRFCAATMPLLQWGFVAAPAFPTSAAADHVSARGLGGALRPPGYAEESAERRRRLAVWLAWAALEPQPPVVPQRPVLATPPQRWRCCWAGDVPAIASPIPE